MINRRGCDNKKECWSLVGSDINSGIYWESQNAFQQESPVRNSLDPKQSNSVTVFAIGEDLITKPT